MQESVQGKCQGTTNEIMQKISKEPGKTPRKKNSTALGKKCATNFFQESKAETIE